MRSFISLFTRRPRSTTHRTAAAAHRTATAHVAAHRRTELARLDAMQRRIHRNHMAQW